MTTATLLPGAAPGEEFAIASVQRWASAMGRRSTVPAYAATSAGEPVVASPAPSGDVSRVLRGADALSLCAFA